jgi:hypothetical protein
MRPYNGGSTWEALSPHGFQARGHPKAERLTRHLLRFNQTCRAVPTRWGVVPSERMFPCVRRIDKVAKMSMGDAHGPRASGDDILREVL